MLKTGNELHRGSTHARTLLRLLVLGVCTGALFFTSCQTLPLNQYPAASPAGTPSHRNPEAQFPQSSATAGPETIFIPSPFVNDVSGRRTALIIGNKDYTKYNKLPNTINDTSDLAAALKQLGFEVTLQQNLDLGAMQEQIDNFKSKLQNNNGNYETVLFYFAGHGAQVDGKDYLVPINNDGDIENDINNNSYLLDKAIDNICLAKCPMNIIIIDACRDNPLAMSWGRSVPAVGLVIRQSSPQMFLIYSAKGGTVARDGDGEKNSPFAKYLLRYMTQPGLGIRELFKKVRDGVSTETHGKQEVTFQQIGENEKILVLP